jgi:O-antigen/teichoic acid export membrane protein
MLLVFSVVGVSVTAIKFTAENKENIKTLKLLLRKVYCIAFFSSSLISFLLYFFSDAVSVLMVDDQSLSFVFKLCSYMVFFNSINQVQFGILSGLGAFKIVAISNVVGGIVSMLFCYFLITRFEVLGYVYSVLLSYFFIFIVNGFYIIRYSKRCVSTKDEKAGNEVKVLELIKYSLPNLFSGVLFSFSSWFVVVLISKRLGLSDVGLFNAVNQVVGILYIAPTMFAQVLMSYVASLKLSRKILLYKGILYVAIFSFFVSMLVLIFSDYILAFYSDSFANSGYYLIASIPVFLMLSIYSQLNHYLLGSGYVKYSLVSVLVYSFLLIFLSISLIDSGVLGMIFSKTIAIFLQVMVCIYFVKYKCE